MSYRVVVARSAGRQLAERLPEAVAAACVEFIFGPLAGDPHHVGAPLREPYKGLWRPSRSSVRLSRVPVGRCWRRPRRAALIGSHSMKQRQTRSTGFMTTKRPVLRWP